MNNQNGAADDELAALMGDFVPDAVMRVNKFLLVLVLYLSK